MLHMFWHPSKSRKWNLLDRWHYYITISPGCHGDGGDKSGAETPPEYLTVCCPTLIPITPPPTCLKKHYTIYLTKYLILVFCLQIYGSSIFSCFTISSSLFFVRSRSPSAAKTKSALYTRHHNNHKCSDRFAATALRCIARKKEK